MVQLQVPREKNRTKIHLRASRDNKLNLERKCRDCSYSKMCLVCLYCTRFCSLLSSTTYFPAPCDFCIGRLFCKEVELIFQWKRDNIDFPYFCPMKQFNITLLLICLFKCHHSFKVKHMPMVICCWQYVVLVRFHSRKCTRHQDLI